MASLASVLEASGKPFYIGKPISIEECREQGIDPYLPSPNLVNAVNLTIFLEKRPLLLKGEPGCGKTRLAQAVAHELGLPLETWYIKSTSKARDGLYTYDAIGRLHDAQLVQIGKQSRSKVKDLNHYIKKGPLGRAFENDRQTIILIDEIDKADIDFPNDLLREIDEQKFTIEETGEEVVAKYPPIVFVTSNDEKDLPDAFLRRCLFYYIEFPYLQLPEIVKVHFPQAAPELVKTAVNRFSDLRQTMESGKTGKKVSTSELLDWFAVLYRVSKDDEGEILKQLEGEIPFSEVLLKKWEDHLRYLKNET